MTFQPHAVHGGLDGRVQELHDEHEQHARDHERVGRARGPQPQPEPDRGRDQDQGKQALLAEGVFEAVGVPEAFNRVVQGVPQAGQAGLAFEWTFHESLVQGGLRQSGDRARQAGP